MRLELNYSVWPQMENPYKPPRAIPSPAPRVWRFGHSLTAFASGLLATPSAVYLTALLLFPDVPLARGNSTFWGAVTLGSMLAAASVYRYKRIPLWLAATVGTVVAPMLALAPAIWSEMR